MVVSSLIDIAGSLSILHNYLYASVFLVALYAVLWLYTYAIKPSSPKIEGLDELPGGIPFWGNLKQLGDDHPTNLQRLSLKYNMPAFQCLFGNQRMVVLNSFDCARDWFIKNQAALIDRPVFYTFHKVSQSQGLTIGTSPWNDTCKRRRLNVQRYMTSPAIQKLASLLDLESFSLIRDISRDKSTYIYPYRYTQRLALNFTTMLSYATRFDDINNEFLTEILNVVKVISSFRSTNNNLQDFMPLYRFSHENERAKLSTDARAERDEWLSKLTEEAIDHKVDRTSIVGGFANSDGHGRLNLDDIKSICVGLVSGGFETLGSTGSLVLAQLAADPEMKWQERVYNECLAEYGTVENAWEKVLLEEKSPFAVSFVKEILRMYPVIPLIPARKTAKSFQWGTANVPKGVTVILNAQAANHDKAHFGETVDQFIPERFLEESTINKPPYHFTFGAGSRVCTAVNLSGRVLYVLLTRACLLFKVQADPSRLPVTDYIDYAEDRTAQTYWPSEFGMKLTPRDEKTLANCLDSSKKKCADMLDFSIERDERDISN